MTPVLWTIGILATAVSLMLSVALAWVVAAVTWGLIIRRRMEQLVRLGDALGFDWEPPENMGCTWCALGFPRVPVSIMHRHRTWLVPLMPTQVGWSTCWADSDWEHRTVAELPDEVVH